MISRIVPSSVSTLLFTEAALITTAYLAGYHFTNDIDPAVWLLYDNGLYRVLILAAALLLGIYFQDLYSVIRPQSRILLLQQYCFAFGMGFLFQALLSYGAPALVLPRRTMMFGSIALIVLLPGWRVLYGALVAQAFSTERLLFLGASQTACRVVERIQQRPEYGLSPVGFVADGAEASSLAAPLLGPLSRFREIVAQTRPDRVVVGLLERRGAVPMVDLLDVNFSGVAVEDAAVTFEQVFQRVSTDHLRPSQLIFSRELGPRPGTVQFQSLYSTVVALAASALLAPFLLVVAVLVRLTSPGPAFYRQTRVGCNGQVFTLYKFRSMSQDAEKATGAVWAARNDPRVTPLGRWLRRLRIDELPQLINVLKGEMSIVGPRPERPEFVATLSNQIPFYRQRHCIRPGITGWAQINHKYGDTIEDTITKLEYDLYYIKNMSPAMDFYIIFQTLKVMLLTRGAQ